MSITLLIQFKGAIARDMTHGGDDPAIYAQTIAHLKKTMDTLLIPPSGHRRDLWKSGVVQYQYHDVGKDPELVDDLNRIQRHTRSSEELRSSLSISRVEVIPGRSRAFDPCTPSSSSLSHPSALGRRRSGARSRSPPPRRDGTVIHPSRRNLLPESHSQSRNGSIIKREGSTSAAVEHEGPRTRDLWSTSHIVDNVIDKTLGQYKSVDRSLSGRTAVPDETGSSTEKPAPQDRTDEYMTRELEKLQGIMASLRSRERDLIAVLRKKGATPPGPLYPEQKDLEELLRSRDEQVRSLREELQEERRARHDLKWSYESERLRREQAEKSLADASRELQDRMIAPALLEAFMRVSNLAGNVLDSIHDDLCPPALLHTHTTDLTHLASPDWD